MSDLMSGPGMDALKSHHGVTLTYTEAGGAAQSAKTGLSEDFTEGEKKFTFDPDDLTVVSYVGAKITDSDGLVYKVQRKEPSAGRLVFIGIRAVERS